MNWVELIADLRSRGWTQNRLADRLGVAQSAISELGSGKTADPRFTTGDALRALHQSGERFADSAEIEAA
jgi:transcriptional regulator with XRE-family HTH domain